MSGPAAAGSGPAAAGSGLGIAYSCFGRNAGIACLDRWCGLVPAGAVSWLDVLFISWILVTYRVDQEEDIVVDVLDDDVDSLQLCCFLVINK